jgi:fatty acid/phospholipid biosynthesis enzyme
VIYGVNGVVWLGHSRSKSSEVAESIHQVKLAVEADFLGELKSELGKLQ